MSDYDSDNESFKSADDGLSTNLDSNYAKFSAEEEAVRFAQDLGRSNRSSAHKLW